jgi:hypothetical protein
MKTEALAVLANESDEERQVDGNLSVLQERGRRPTQLGNEIRQKSLRDGESTIYGRTLRPEVIDPEHSRSKRSMRDIA